MANPETSVLPVLERQTKFAETVMRISKQELKIPSEAKQILLTKTPSGWVSEEVASLGETQVFIKRDGNRDLQLIYKRVKLSETNKEIVRLGKKDDDPWIITVGGYNKLNQIAGLYIITPPSIEDKGETHPNPYVQYSGDGEILRVIARKIVFGFGPNGNPVAIDTVRHYNFEAYFMQDVMAKAKWKAECARFGTEVFCPFQPAEWVSTTPGGLKYVRSSDKIYRFLKIKGMEGVWIDTNSDEIRSIYDQHIQHQKFGDQIAQSMTTRNALKAHPAIAATAVEVKNGIASVLVFGYKHGLEEQSLKKIGEQIMTGGGVVMPGQSGKGIDVVQSVGEDTIEEVQANESHIVDETAAGTDGPKATAGESQSFEQLVERAILLAKERGANVEKFSKNIFETRFNNLTPDQLRKLIVSLEKVTNDAPGTEKKS